MSSANWKHCSLLLVPPLLDHLDLHLAQLVERILSSDVEATSDTANDDQRPPPPVEEAPRRLHHGSHDCSLDEGGSFATGEG